MKRIASLLVVALAASSTLAQDAPRSDGWVVLPVEEYRALRAKAYPPDPESEPPPVDATLTRVEYDIRVVGESAVGEARMTVDVLKEGWVKVPIPSGLLVREARIDGRPLSLVEKPSPHVLLSRPGRAVLSLQVATAVSSSAGVESLSLPSSLSASTRVALVVSRTGVDLSVSGGLLAERAEATSESRFLAYGRAGEPLAFSWRKKRDDQGASRPLRLRGSVTEIVGLAEDGVQISASVGVEVVQGLASSVELALPEGLVVNEVSGAAVADWEFAAGALRVTFLEPLEGSTSFMVVGEARTAREGTIAVPLLRLRQAERETGGVAVEVLGAGEIKDQAPRGLDAADPSDLGDAVVRRDSPSLVAFRFRPLEGSAARSLTVAVSRYTPQAILVANVEEARYEVLLSEEGKTLVRARYAVRNNQRSFLALTLPGSASLWSASVGGLPIRPGRSAEGALLLPLEKGRTGENAPAFAVEVVYVDRSPAWTADGRANVPLPALDLQVSRTAVVARYSPRFRVTNEPGPFRVGAYEEPASEAFRLPPGAPPAGEAGRLSKREPESKDAIERQSLLDRFQKEGRANRVAGVLPLQVPFPSFGSALFLVSELTPEASAPSLVLSYRRAVKGGGR